MPRHVNKKGRPFTERRRDLYNQRGYVLYHKDKEQRNQRKIKGTISSCASVSALASTAVSSVSCCSCPHTGPCSTDLKPSRHTRTRPSAILNLTSSPDQLLLQSVNHSQDRSHVPKGPEKFSGLFLRIQYGPNCYVAPPTQVLRGRFDRSRLR